MFALPRPAVVVTLFASARIHDAAVQRAVVHESVQNRAHRRHVQHPPDVFVVFEGVFDVRLRPPDVHDRLGDFLNVVRLLVVLL